MNREEDIIENLKQFITIHKIKFAKTFLQQSLGLMFRDCIPHDFGLWFQFRKPKTVLVHTFFMQFNIDIIFFGEKQKVVRIVRNMKPWKVVKVKGVKEFLEVKGGNII